MAQSLIAKVSKKMGTYYKYDACVVWQTNVCDFRDRLSTVLDFFARFAIIELKSGNVVVLTPADTV